MNPKLGAIIDNDEQVDGVLLLENQDYGIDSHYQLVEKQGYIEDIAGKKDQYTKRYKRD